MKNFDSNVITAISAVALILLITVVLLTSCAPVKKESQTLNLIADAKNILVEHWAVCSVDVIEPLKTESFNESLRRLINLLCSKNN
jgi:hypothetical protein